MATNAAPDDVKPLLDFDKINAAAMRELPALLLRWLPDGQVRKHEYISRNPRRADKHRGSFKVNLQTCKWADFATGDKGGDPISLAAYLFGLTQYQAAQCLARMFGVSMNERI
jgi:hypothetical protein